MSDATPICAPLESVNDETVKLLSWAVKDGQTVRDGQLLAELETSKAVVEMIAPRSGKVWLKIQAGQEVGVGTILAFITTNGAPAPDVVVEHLESAASRMIAMPGGSKSRSFAVPAGISISKKALALLERHGLTPDVIPGKAMIREQDVEEYLAAKTATNHKAECFHFALKGLSLENVTLPRTLESSDRGHLDPKFLQQLQADLATFARLPSSEKCALYRKHGAEIGEDVELGANTVLIAPRISLGDEVRLGENSSVICRERFSAAALTSFRQNLNIRGGTVVFGENVFGGQNIRIGGGGNADPWSLLAVGADTYLGDDLFINICRPVVIGKETFLTQRSILITHNIGHSVLEGYENRFAPIVLEDFSQVGMNCTIYAGSTVGRNAIVGSNSYVVSSIAAGKMAIGVPARVVRDAVRPLDREQRLAIAKTMVADYRELLGLKGLEVSELERAPRIRFFVSHNDKKFQLVFMETFSGGGEGVENADETIVWTFDSPRNEVPPEITVMNLLSKQISGPSGLFVNSTREFLRKRGIRCQPGPWRYKGGLI